MQVFSSIICIDSVIDIILFIDILLILILFSIKIFQFSIFFIFRILKYYNKKPMRSLVHGNFIVYEKYIFNIPYTLIES
ncbi:hypothetical protein BMW23_1008 [Bodo saltans virus]|uniref:Transmembrane protein n=1 Tax=Bodo saltans virus TaxID=2024608 RepID=A0A2H4UVV0_9VIRU|nr:hypothetical protein QJ851_gp0990 [Bodo saltans virus]ATZ81053.1 hypothetical protein BMW23_1008 [Bodo saltans virus]